MMKKMPENSEVIPAGGHVVAPEDPFLLLRHCRMSAGRVPPLSVVRVPVEPQGRLGTRRPQEVAGRVLDRERRRPGVVEVHRVLLVPHLHHQDGDGRGGAAVGGRQLPRRG